MSWLRSREVVEKEEAERLAPWALRSAESVGRVVEEPCHPYRTAFQRDRDRVIHSRGFRRLQYKTQVFVYHEGDHYRNRLTHTLEGAQIGRTIAKALRVNEELCEAIALAHDLGHTPFGHAGEAILAELMRDDGGFDHNRQSLRVVDLLEEQYATFQGLNLTDETREGILKHGCRWSHPVRLPELLGQRSIEAQIADVADEIAYVNHDLEDGLQSGVLELEALAATELWSEARARVGEELGYVSERVLRRQTIVALINAAVTDLIESTAARIDAAGVSSVDEVRRYGEPLVGYSSALDGSIRDLKRFLRDNFYHHPRVMRMTRKAETIVADLFRVYREMPALLPPRLRDRVGSEGEARAVADYVAGMTDRFAMSEHRKLLDPHELL